MTSMRASLTAAVIASAALAAPAAAQTGTLPAPPPAGAPPAAAQERAEPTTRAERLDKLFAELRAAQEREAESLQRRIVSAWSDSGSESMDFLLIRGREAMEKEAFDKAVDHLDALIDLAPDFAEGWNARATARFMQDELWMSMADIQRALALEPRHFGALIGAATILERIGDEAGALTAARAALEVNPHLAQAEEMVSRLAPKVDGRDI